MLENVGKVLRLTEFLTLCLIKLNIVLVIASAVQTQTAVC